MIDDRYRFKLGNCECLAILDMNYSFGNADFLFPNVPHSLLKQENINPDVIHFTGICLAVNTGIEWVLLDAGIGFLHEGSQLASILEEENIQPNHIILTHPHGDHYGGLLDSDLTPLFPNVPLYMCRDEWADYTSEAFYETSTRPPVIREHLLRLESQVELVACDQEFLPGFRMRSLPGHTAHHVGIEVESNGETLLFASDTVCHPLHIEHLDWQCSVDADHDLARETRIRFAKMAAENGHLIHLFHFDFPGLGHIVPNGNGWKWQPLA